MERPQTVWITGAGGLIGSYLVKTAPSKWKARGLTRNDVDLLDFKSVERLFHEERPSAIIHSAAISKNPVCDANPNMASKVNFLVSVALADLAQDIPFIFL